MFGIIGLTAILGCTVVAVLGVVATVVTAAVSIGVSVSQAQAQAESQQDMLEAQEKAEKKQLKIAENNKEIAFRAQARNRLSNLQAIGSGILLEQAATRTAKLKTANLMSSNSQKSHYYGKPASA